jgi:uncharacterized protein with HEPN domain
VRDDRLYLVHIRECIVRIRRYTAAGQAEFLGNEMVQDAVIRNLQILAESTQRLSASLKDQWPALDWGSIAGFRNVVVHGYLGVDLAQIWRIVERDISPLDTAIRAMLDTLGVE